MCVCICRIVSAGTGAGYTEYQKTREEKEKEGKLLDQLVAIVNERAVLEERKLAYEIK